MGMLRTFILYSPSHCLASLTALCTVPQHWHLICKDKHFKPRDPLCVSEEPCVQGYHLYNFKGSHNGVSKLENIPIDLGYSPSAEGIIANDFDCGALDNGELGAVGSQVTLI